MDWKHLLLSFEGRISRQPFWIGFLVLSLANIAAQAYAQKLDGERLVAIVDLAFTYPNFALFAKRAHDRNMPIWVPGLFFAMNAVVSFWLVAEWAGTAEERTPQFLFMSVALLIFGLALLIDLGARRGVVGGNQFGPDPLDGSQ